MGTLGGNLATDAVHAAVGGLRASFGFFGDLIDKGAELEETGARLGDTFGAAGARMARMADEAAAKFGQSKIEFINGAREIGAAFENAHFQAADAAMMTERLSAVASQYARKAGIPLADAFSQVQQAIEGMNRGLKGVQLNLDDAEVKLRAMTVALPGDIRRYNGPGEFTEAALEAARADLMIQKFQARMGGMAGGENRYGGLMGQFWGRIDNVMSQIGRAILPMVETLMRALNYLTSSLQPIIDVIAAKAKQISNTIANWVKYLALIGTHGAKVWELFRLKAIDVWGEIMTVAGNAFSNLADFVIDLFEQVGTAIGVRIYQGLAATWTGPHSNMISRQMAAMLGLQPINGPMPGISPRWGLLTRDVMRGVGPGANQGPITELRTFLDSMLKQAGLGNIAGGKDNGAGKGPPVSPQMGAMTTATHTEVASFAKQLQEKISGTNYAQQQTDLQKRMAVGIEKLAGRRVPQPDVPAFAG